MHVFAIGLARLHHRRGGTAGRFLTRVITHFRIHRAVPKLRQRPKKAFLLRLTPAEQLGRQRIENHADASAQDEESGIPVIAFADNDITLGKFSDTGVVQENAVKRNSGRKTRGIDGRERRNRQEMIDILLRHGAIKWHVPTLRTGDSGQ